MNIRSFLVFAFDLLMVVVAWVLSFLIRFNLDWPGAYWDEILYGALILLPVQLLACHWAGLYRGMWSFASLPDLRRLVKAVLVSLVAVLLLTMYSKPYLLIPRSMAVLYPLLLLVLMGGARIAGRMWKDRLLLPGARGQGKPVVIVGAGTAGAMLLRELARSPDWAVVAMVDDDRHKRGLEILGCRVEGSTDDLPTVLQRHGARHVILAMPSAPAVRLQSASHSPARRSGAARWSACLCAVRSWSSIAQRHGMKPRRSSDWMRSVPCCCASIRLPSP